MQVLRAADHRRMPWKNGGGETVEIAVSPPGAGLDDFDWRVSTATVDADGSFSSFPGVDRTLCLLSGEGMILSVGDRDPVSLGTVSEPYSFPADVPTSARLIHGTITDLNVMTRRGRYSHRICSLPAPSTLAPSSFARLLLCRRGELDVGLPGDTIRLSLMDALLLGADAQEHLSLSGDAEAFLIELCPFAP